MIEPTASRPLSGEVVQEVRSAEQVALHFPIAGPGTRVLAYAADAVIVAVLQISFIVLLLLTTPLARVLNEFLAPFLEEMRGGGRTGDAAISVGMLTIALAIIAQLMIEWSYFMISERVTGGRSIGKRLVGLRVIGQDGLPLTARASLVRNLLRAVDMLPGSYVVGLVAIVASAKCQRLGDLAAGTIVVRLDPGDLLAAPIEPPSETGADLGAFRFSHAQIAALGPLERQLLRQTLRRLDVLDAEHAAAVLERTVEVLRGRLGYEPVPADQRLAFLHALLRTLEHA